MKQEMTRILTKETVYAYEDVQIYLSIENQGPGSITYSIGGSDTVLASGESSMGDVTFDELTITPAASTTVVTKSYTSDMDAENIKLKNEIDLQNAALSGDMVWVVTPSTAAPLPTAEVWTREVVVELQNADGDIHTWFTQTIASGNSIANDSVAGTATIESTTLTMVNGQATVTISGDAEAWLDTETDTYTVTELTLLGYTIAAATSVETFTAAAE